MTSVLDFMNQYKTEVKARTGNRTKTTRVPDGKSRWRLLPSWRGVEDNQFFHEFGAHYVKNSAGDIKAVYVCTARTYKRDCPICDMISDAISGATSDEMVKTMKEANASSRVLMNALPISGDGKVSTDPVILELPFSAINDIIEIITEGALDEPDFNILTHPKRGTYISVDREGTGRSTKYRITPGTKAVPLKEGVMEKAHDLDEWVSQEYPEGKAKAIAAVRSVSGLLPTPTASLFAETSAARTGSTSAESRDEVDIDDDELDDLLGDVV